MPVLSVLDIVELRINGFLYGQKTISVFHYQVTNLLTSESYFTALNLLLTVINGGTFRNAYLDCCGSDFTWLTTEVQKVSPTREVLVAQPLVMTGTGGVSSGATNIARVVTKRSDIISHTAKGSVTHKGGQGGVHIPDPPVAHFSQGTLTPGGIAKSIAFGVQMVNSFVTLTGDAYAPVIWHRKDLPQPSANPVVGTVPQNQIRVEKRRTVGHGI